MRVIKRSRGHSLQGMTSSPACGEPNERRGEQDGELAMTYRIMTWAAVAWIAIWLTPYVYAVNDLITWR
jgi:hypothetical protein